MKKVILAGIVLMAFAACSDNPNDNNRSKMNNNSTEGIENNNYTSDTNGNTLDTDTIQRVKPQDSAKQPPL